MGLTIHYQGRFRKRASLPEFIAEVSDIAETLNWPSHVFETDFLHDQVEQQHDGKLYGLLITPPECEPLHLTFLSNRRMSSVLTLSVWGKPGAEDVRGLYRSFTKTQFGGPDVHIIIVNLMRYLSKKYFAGFKLYDESRYWETGDEPFMREQFAFLDRAIRGVAEAIEQKMMRPGESWEEYILRMASGVKRDLDR